MAQQTLADRVGVSRNAVSQWEAGEDPTLSNLRKVQKILGVNFSLDEVSGNLELVDMKARSIEYLEVRGEVRERAWIEMDQPPPGRAAKTIPVPPNPKYGRAPQFAMLVTGPCANSVAEDGEYVIVASWKELGREPLDGDLVVVRRERAMTYEDTIKRVHHVGDVVELRSVSDDPGHQAKYVLDSKSNRDIKIRIIGLVIGKYTEF